MALSDEEKIVDFLWGGSSGDNLKEFILKYIF